MEKFEEKENEILKMLRETSKLYANIFIGKQTELLANEVEFWKWLDKNYYQFHEIEKIKEIFSKKGWITNLQGKQYEWLSVNQMRNDFKNIFSKFDLGTNPTQKGIDIVETNIFTDKVKNTYQNKAYYSSKIPDLKNTPKDAVIITNSEKLKNVQDMGYEAKEYLNANEGLKTRNQLIEKAKSGKINIKYNFKNVTATMGKAGIAGLIIGMGIETIASYKKWKKGEITTDDYLKEILISGGQTGINGAMTAGLMVPVSATVVAMGASAFINYPVAMVISIALDKIISPVFGRGKYKEYLDEARYYQNLNNFYNDFAEKLIFSQKEYEKFIFNILQQEEEFNILLEENNKLNDKISEKNRELDELFIKISGGNK